MQKKVIKKLGYDSLDPGLIDPITSVGSLSLQTLFLKLFLSRSIISQPAFANSVRILLKVFLFLAWPLRMINAESKSNSSFFLACQSRAYDSRSHFAMVLAILSSFYLVYYRVKIERFIYFVFFLLYYRVDNSTNKGWWRTKWN